MACRAALLAFLLLVYSAGDLLARDCTCKKIGFGVCVPDPDCTTANAVFRAQTIEKAQEASKALEKAASQSVGTTAQKSAVRDASKAIEEFRKSIRETASPIKSLIILETGYSQLSELGKEEAGYGLYSYAVLSSNSDRSAAFLAEVFKSVPAIEETAAKPAQLNIFYVPAKKERSGDFASALTSSGDDFKKLGGTYAALFYDYKVARAILDHICNPPADGMNELCKGDTSRGPYIFTYEKPASDMEPVPPPFLFVDLSDVHQGAFGEFVSAFKSQVKQEDFASGAKLNTKRLALLKIALKASDWIPAVQKSVTDIVHSIVLGGK